jgi:F-type H+-transporting ATPase subunit delta
VSTLADHYADALADVAIQQNSVAQIRQELAAFLGLVRDSHDLALILDSPAVQRANKRAVIEALVAQMGASRTVRNFLFVVVDRGRTRLLLEIQASFDRRLDERQGIVRAEVSSARGLTDVEKAELSKALARLTGRRVEAAYRRDPALLAGTVVRVGSTIYDGSVRTQLEKMRERMASE